MKLKTKIYIGFAFEMFYFMISGIGIFIGLFFSDWLSFILGIVNLCIALLWAYLVGQMIGDHAVLKYRGYI